MAACLFNHHWPDCRITLIESSAIGIIGVGEGSTPQLKSFFNKIGIAESEWMPAANATYKNGIHFEGWSSDPQCKSYFHPFNTTLDVHTLKEFFLATLLRRSGRDVPTHPDLYLLPARVTAQNRGPGRDEDWPFDIAHSYHFDAHEVGQVLKRVATARGVEWIDARIADVEIDGDGAVSALLSDDGQRLTADFFVDASGFGALIIEKALGAKHRGFEENLFNDRAVVMPTPVAPSGPEPATRAIAMEAGWRWSIPLQHRTGNGYVFSSRYLDKEQAEEDLRSALGVGNDVEARHLQMRCGRMEDSWVSNCLAIGLAQGFLEPLEATALHLTINTLEAFITAIERDGMNPDVRTKFNEEIGARFEGIRDYIVCHYRASSRRDNEYWRDNTSHDRLSDPLKEIFTAWYTAKDLVPVLRQQTEYYPAMSWHCLFAGYGNFPPDEKLKPSRADDPLVDTERVQSFLDTCASHYRPHAEMLAALEKGD